jgi:hypothetical protein
MLSAVSGLPLAAFADGGAEVFAPPHVPRIALARPPPALATAPPAVVPAKDLDAEAIARASPGGGSEGGTTPAEGGAGGAGSAAMRRAASSARFAPGRGLSPTLASAGEGATPTATIDLPTAVAAPRSA